MMEAPIDAANTTIVPPIIEPKIKPLDTDNNSPPRQRKRRGADVEGCEQEGREKEILGYVGFEQIAIVRQGPLT